MKRYLLLLSAFPICSQASAREWITPDFYLDHSTAVAPLYSAQKSKSHPPECRAKIAEVMCLVDPVPGQIDPSLPRPCLQGGQAYAHLFEELYDHYPPALQKMFCSLNRINIEKEFFGTAYAGLTKDPKGNVNGAALGIRKSVLDENLDLATWASWKEQLSYGGVTDSYRVTPGLPLIRTNSKPGVSDFLYFVVAHEFGHLFDFSNDLNKTVPCLNPGDECDMAPESWGALSWRTDQHPLTENEFADRTGLCFYWCKGSSIELPRIAALYDELFNATRFISIYATTQPWDDFADSLAYFLAARELGMLYEVDTAQGKTYDIIAKLSSPHFATKYEYIDRFLKRNDIRYP